MALLSINGIDDFASAVLKEDTALTADIGEVTVNTINDTGKGYHIVVCTDSLGTRFNALVLGSEASSIQLNVSKSMTAQQIKGGNLILSVSNG